ncbi:unnamed protein product [Caenorhabditis angaria]|uniref:Anaphase-promoting complex subunit 4-like WD40 domain-containing protein n=1 Tax=Caenorhabditis angaria TaxID=860376 RepID=A0A9P1IGA3_9PELO|nr:unnamed protein product [Caenorhabditis angaria]
MSLVATFSSLPKTIRGFSTQLTTTPNGESVVYCNGNSVYIVNIENSTVSDIYTEHPVPTTIAKFSPSGYYCVSGDQNGNVRIWDTTQTTHILKATYQVFSGSIRDISWSEDSKRLAVVGEGKERFGHVFLFDTGTSNGNLSGPTRPVNSVDFKPTRPYRLITGSEDNTVAIFDGPPFKFRTILNNHTRFVLVTRFNPSGTLYASAGSDGKVFIYSSQNDSVIGELIDSKNVAHLGSVFGLTWSFDGENIATASGDKTVKIWSGKDFKLLRTINFGSSIDDQQLGIVWTSKYLMSVSLSGFLNKIDPVSGKILESRQGHNKPITAMSLGRDGCSIFTSDSMGNTSKFDFLTGKSTRLDFQSHKSQIVGIQQLKNGGLITVGWDDMMNVTNSNGITNSFCLPSQPTDIQISSDDGFTLVSCYNHVMLKGQSKPIDYHSTCCSISPISDLIAIGAQDSKVRIYNRKFEIIQILQQPNSSQITDVSFSPNGNYLAVTDNQRRVIVYSIAQNFNIILNRVNHLGKVNCVSWSPNNSRIATGGLDNSIIIWNVKYGDEEPILIKAAHKMSSINKIVWIDDNQIASAGQDSNLKIWSV